ncbi:MFS transporter [Paramicrobacterium chengjingii]|uniref:MFS transporter n=1 Tax=Paramicrobacterium chengjingii TaxID=2769067 RepID=A0ABX6YI93_9MICO|nr:MFS transporter [Microbacterium chengjingii]QPZ38070.1 MFS transporter [Microbacterium chengjingii]
MTETTATEQRRVRKVMSASAIGHFVEWFDFAVYAYAAPVIAMQFFPEFDATAALLSTFAVYTVGFVARPVGAFMLGALGDRYGRKRILASIILLMGLSTTLIGLLPTYAVIGVAAPLLLVLLRILQGLSAAGETIGSNSFVAEHSPIATRGRNVGIVYTASNLPPVLAALLVLGLTTALSPDSYEAWGWRIPFLLGAPLAIIGLYIRTRVDESPAFVEMRETKKVEKAPIRAVFAEHWRAMLFVFSMAAVASLGYYSLTGYFYSYMTVTLGLSSQHALISNSIALLITFVTVPIAAMVSDRIGRKRMLLIGIAFSAVIALPAYLLVGVGTLGAVIIAQALLGFGLGLVFGPAGPAYVEMFPARVRYTGASISYNLAFTIFGGTAPLLATALITWTGSTIAPAWYIVAVTILAFAVLLRMPETRSRSMRDEAIMAAAAKGEHSNEPSQPERL